jgi:hypothetical protein
MRRRLPSPALVIASAALFAALAGAGFAASFAYVRSAKPITLIPASVSADGKVTGARVTGQRVSQGVYTLTIHGATFAANNAITPVQSMISPDVITIVGSNRTTPSSCEVASQTVPSNGSAQLEVDCFSLDSSTATWLPADAAFTVDISGPTAG